MVDQTPYYVAFSHCLGIGPVAFGKLTAHFKTPQASYEAKKDELLPLLGSSLTEKFLNFRSSFDPIKRVNELYKKDIQVLVMSSPDYPKLLAQISDPPICLYLVGDKTIFSKNDDHFFAVVGTRRITSYGKQITQQLVSGLVDYGFVIVSGMALGVDAAAHWAAINAGGKTVAVLGCGVDIIYPPANKSLYDTIVKSGGAIVSEFPPGMTTLPGFFVSRNRIVSGLSRGVLVVEGAEQSGTLITARYAAEQGRDVFAPPSPITSPLSQAPNKLIKQGAKMVTDITDIIEEYNLTVKTETKNAALSGLTGIERNVVEALVDEPHTADDLRDKLQVPIDAILNTLTMLELNGAVAKNEEGKYYIK